MTILTKIAPDLRPLPNTGNGNNGIDSNSIIQEFPYELTSYVSQLEHKILTVLNVNSWGWRKSVVTIMTFQVLLVSFRVMETAFAAISALFALIQTRDVNDHDFRHLTCWVGKGIEETLFSCFAPFGAIIMLCYGGPIFGIFQRSLGSASTNLSE